MATLCSGGSVRTYSKRRSSHPGIRNKSSTTILAQAFFVRPFALLVLLSRASSRPPCCCFRRRKVKPEYSLRGNLKTMASKKQKRPWQERGPSIPSSCGGVWRSQTNRPRQRQEGSEQKKGRWGNKGGNKHRKKQK